MALYEERKKKEKEIEKTTLSLVKKFCAIKYPEGTGPKRAEWHKWVYASGRKK